MADARRATEGGVARRSGRHDSERSGVQQRRYRSAANLSGQARK
jgi:hypothetical protein